MVSMGRGGIIEMRDGSDGCEGHELSKVGSGFNLSC